MSGSNTDKPFGNKNKKFTRHEKSTEERRKRQATALRTNLKKRKEQIRKQRTSNYKVASEIDK